MKLPFWQNTQDLQQSLQQSKQDAAAYTSEGEAHCPICIPAHVTLSMVDYRRDACHS